MRTAPAPGVLSQPEELHQRLADIEQHYGRRGRRLILRKLRQSNMLWPHKINDRHWITGFRTCCAIAVVSGACFPGLDPAERALVLVLGLFGLASGFLTYGLLLFITRAIPAFHRPLALFLFYGGLLSVASAPAQLATGTTGTTSQHALAVWFALTFNGSLGVIATAHNALERRF